MRIVEVVRGWFRRVRAREVRSDAARTVVLAVEGVCCVAPSDAPRPRTGTMTVEPMGCSSHRYG